MDCYKQIAEIRGVADYKRVCTSMEESYGPPPQSCVNLLVIALMKSYACKMKVKKISVGPKGGALEFTELAALGSPQLSAAMEQFKSFVSLEMTSAPVLRFKNMGDGAKTMVQMTRFLKFASTFH